MENIGDYDMFCNELTVLNINFKNKLQICNNDHNLDLLNKMFDVDITGYTEKKSLLTLLESDYICEFIDGKITQLTKYQILINLGSYSESDILVGQIPENYDINKCYFYGDYFIFHPKNIIYSDCNEKCCAINILMTKETWCNKCGGQLNANILWNLVQKEINFSNISKNSVLYIRKINEDVDLNDIICLQKISNYLDGENYKIKILQQRINDINEKIKYYTEYMNTRKEYNETIIYNLLNNKGCQLNEFNILIDEINKKIELLSS
ncbi:hypothetical protein [Bandra megavirus]|uniref:Uncharacterized protein n=1 Tax=Bandra megavirus TaxID=2071566 RepID=A0A2K9V811_9VIRU|nr:hypothetical protein [Bandra megavirus]